ncbi:iron-sulfur cluster repair di-iron protein [Pedobacter sp. BS3]|uniref:iron-sulfur cluster repair di-iron protein n=1 Tax=Pedobacter sp. BS3 TaxID=2567937 RepID=UPI0011EC5A50|nr:iron-sulfur cluster repair di-iron protein [Pedobacter sp. BS3]TZF84801.1 iron-sulfur cluster repair di-iron protein [Pedobacter sp. BS3]
METLEDIVINVPEIEPREKHPTIFRGFDGLAEGSSLIILNDHDPRPVYYQLLGERGNVFTWEYLEQGPIWWKVRITKRITGKGDETLGEIAAKDLRKAEIFKKYGLDFCCGGKKTIKEACAEKGLDVTEVENALQEADKAQATVLRPLPYNDWGLDFLADYIVNMHHSYVKKYLPEIQGYATKVASVHGSQHEELFEIKQLVDVLSEELADHLLKEETIVFPFIKKLVNADSVHGAPTLRSITEKTESEHINVGHILSEIRRLSNNFAVPADGCASYNQLYKLLEEFEADLLTHIHLENNILFKKALILEKKLSQ